MSSLKVYVGSIPGHLSEEVLLKYFRSMVPTVTFSLNRKKQKDSTNSGFGFLTVQTREDVEAIIQTPHILEGRRLKCQEYLTGSRLEAAKENLKRRRLFVRGLKRGITDQDLHFGFSEFGQVESAYVVKIYSTDKTRTFGYVTFKDVRIARQLLQAGAVMIKNSVVYLHPFVKIDGEGQNLKESHMAMMDSSEMHSKRPNSFLPAAVCLDGESHPTRRNQKYFSTNKQQPNSDPQQVRLPTANSGSAPPTTSQDAGDYRFNLRTTVFSSRSDGMRPTRSEFISGSSSQDEQLHLQCTAEFLHGTKPTSRSFQHSRINDANHSASNLSLNVRCPLAQ